MALAIKRAYNLPPDLSCVWHFGPYSSGHRRRSQWQTRLRGMCKGKGTLLRTLTV